MLGNDSPWPRLVRALENIEVAVIHGDGDISGTFVVPRALLFLGYLIKTHFREPAIMVNHSADLDNPALLKVAKEVYPLYDDVVFSDRLSLERCKSVCEGRFAADTASWFKPAARDTWATIAGRPTDFDVWPDTATSEPSEPYVCLGGSSIFHERKNWHSVLNGYNLLIQHLKSTYAGEILLTVSDPLDQSVFRAWETV